MTDEIVPGRINTSEKFITMVVDASRGLDGILAMPANERDFFIMAAVLSSPRSDSFKAHEWKKIKQLADDIVTRRLGDVISGKETSAEWKALLACWVNTRSRKRGRPETNDAFRAMVRSYVNVCIERNPNRLIKEIRGEAAKLLGLSDETVKKIDPNAGERLRDFKKSHGG